MIEAVITDGHPVSRLGLKGTRLATEARGAGEFGCGEEALAMDEERTAILRVLVAELEERDRALEESEERFRLTFERADVGMAHIAPDGTWLKVNGKLSQIVGYSREDLLALTFQDITHPEDLNADLKHVRRMLAGEIHEYSVEKRVVRKDRSRVWVELTVSAVRDREGELAYFISVVKNVTERKLKELLHTPLTTRELEVLQQVAAGLTNREIACKLLYSVGTIKLCVQRLIAKLEVRDREQASARAVDLGLIPRQHA